MISSPLSANQVPEKKIRYRYETSGRWYKGSIHLHTVSSDGHLAFDQVVQKYSSEKFDFISVTDHWCLPDLNGNRETLPLLVINGVELDGYDNLGTYYHVLAIGASLKASFLTRNFLKSLRNFYSQGAVLIWAHPHWTGNSIREGMRHKFHGLEIYNHSSQCENGSGYALSHWDGMLNHNPDFLGFATDDSHFQPDQPYWKGGWIMVNTTDCTQQKILEGIHQGNFYATQGPSFNSIEYGENTVKVETSPVTYVRLIGPRRKGQWIHALDKKPVRQTEFELPPDWHYARLEIEDAVGKRAWTNPLWQYE
ncbi:hypothetical protein D1BOALGB6SA_10846 [Olavius sp. associated proteobacterium Delta 1]|nr:hypothetical protein D1BOALGB6SA_10846 [Olavius sp. associated proteobacterium Delta 1]